MTTPKMGKMRFLDGFHTKIPFSSLLVSPSCLMKFLVSPLANSSLNLSLRKYIPDFNVNLLFSIPMGKFREASYCSLSLFFFFLNFDLSELTLTRQSKGTGLLLPVLLVTLLSILVFFSCLKFIYEFCLENLKLNEKKFKKRQHHKLSLLH